MDQDRDFTDRIDLPQPAWFSLQLAVDHVVLNTLGVQTERRPLSVGTEPHVDQSDGFLVDRRHGERVRAVVPAIQRSGTDSPGLGTLSCQGQPHCWCWPQHCGHPRCSSLCLVNCLLFVDCRHPSWPAICTVVGFNENIPLSLYLH